MRRQNFLKTEKLGSWGNTTSSWQAVSARFPLWRSYCLAMGFFVDFSPHFSASYSCTNRFALDLLASFPIPSHPISHPTTHAHAALKALRMKSRPSARKTVHFHAFGQALTQGKGSG